MEPSLKVFVAKVQMVQDIERQIAVKNNKVTKHKQKLRFYLNSRCFFLNPVSG